MGRGRSKKRWILVAGAILLLVLTGYGIWSLADRDVSQPAPALYLDDTHSFGTDHGRGNLVAVQPYMEPVDYATATNFYAKLDGYMAAAEAQGWLRPDTIVVFPEFIGTWLATVDEKQALYEASTLESAMQTMVASNLFQFASAYVQATGNDRVRDALFRMKADRMAEVYQATFSDLARQYGVTIVAGTLYLPSPSMENGQLRVGDGDIQNVGLVFGADGRAYPDIVRKAFPTADELAFAAGADIAELPAFSTPGGTLGVLICADAWYPQTFDAVARQEPDFLVIPSNLISEEGLDEVWGGYDPGPAPADVDLADVGRLTEGEARIKYTLETRMQATGATAGMHVFFRGMLWDLISHGHTIVSTGDAVLQADRSARAAVVNYWLPQASGK